MSLYSRTFDPPPNPQEKLIASPFVPMTCVQCGWVFVTKKAILWFEWFVGFTRKQTRRDNNYVPARPTRWSDWTHLACRSWSQCWLSISIPRPNKSVVTKTLLKSLTPWTWQPIGLLHSSVNADGRKVALLQKSVQLVLCNFGNENHNLIELQSIEKIVQPRFFSASFKETKYCWRPWRQLGIVVHVDLSRILHELTTHRTHLLRV